MVDFVQICASYMQSSESVHFLLFARIKDVKPISVMLSSNSTLNIA